MTNVSLLDFDRAESVSTPPPRLPIQSHLRSDYRKPQFAQPRSNRSHLPPEPRTLSHTT